MMTTMRMSQGIFMGAGGYGCTSSWAE
jgi:hypothetical protein